MTESETSGAVGWDGPVEGEDAVEGPEFSQDEALFGDPDADADPTTGGGSPNTPNRTQTTQAAGPSAALAAPLALYRRYRPDIFADVIGQQHVTEPLQRALANNRVNHAYLFSGPRGCGKTTSARILARALNCEQGPRPEPCGKCQSCRDLARGGAGSIDVIEIDAASHGGVDDARDLRERAFFAPVASRYKIYIVDEAHMVTTQGFNALLKLVEEPPPHVKFVFATTEPDKVIGTIRSRTHHYPFRLVPPKVLGDYLAHLCQAEGIRVEPAVLPLVVRAGAGSVRDSLSVLDQLLGGADEDGVAYQQAAALLGYTPDSLLDEFVDAFAAGDSGGVFACVDKVIEVGQDPKRFAEDLLRRLRDLVIVAAVPDALVSGLVDVAVDQAERLSSQTAALGAGELTRAAEVIAQGLTEMRGTTAPRLHLELMCARVLLPGADVDERGVHARLDRIERRLGMTGVGGGLESRPPVSPTAEPVSVSDPTDDPELASRETPTPTTEPERAGSVTAERPESTQPSTDSSSGRLGLTVTDVRRLWPEVLEEVKGRRRFTWILLSQNAHVADVHDGVLVLAMAGIGPRDSFAKGGSEDILREALNVALGVDFRIETIVDPSVPSGGGRGATGGGSSQATTGGSSRSSAVPDRSSAVLDSGSDRSDLGSAQPGEPPPSGSVRSAAPAAGGEEELESSASRAAEPSHDPGWREQARKHIRPTRQGGPAQAGAEGEDLRDEVASRNDSDIEDVAESHTDLLARQLGAEIIGEEPHGG